MTKMLDVCQNRKIKLKNNYIRELIEVTSIQYKIITNKNLTYIMNNRKYTY